MGGNFDDQPAAGLETRGDEAAGEQLGDVVLVAIKFPIRRICENEIIACCVALEEGVDLGFHGVAPVEAGLGEVFVDDGDGLTVLVDERTMCCATTESFEAERAGTREEVENLGIFHPLADDVEERLADEIGSRSGDGGGDLDGNASGLTGDDSHKKRFRV